MSTLEPVQQNMAVPLSALYAHERNYRQHPAAQIEKLKASLLRFGQVRSIVVQEDSEGTYTIVAGHGVAAAAQSLVDSDVSYYRQFGFLRADIIPVSWDARQIEGYLLADNQTAQLATDDEELLAQLLEEQQEAGYDLASCGADDAILAHLLEESVPATVGKSRGRIADDDGMEPDEVQTRVRPGDLWALGHHRVLCADSSLHPNIGRVLCDAQPDILHGDPPYGIHLLKKRGRLGKSKVYNPVINDDKSFDPSLYLRHAPITLLWGANHFADKLPPSPFWLVWDKQGGAKDTTFASCELAWCSDSQPARVITHIWDGFRRDSERGEERSHPNQKPVAVISWALEWLSGTSVLEPFLGSGSTLLACEHLQRICFGIEIDPGYVDVAIRRWEHQTGETASLLERMEG